MRARGFLLATVLLMAASGLLFVVRRPAGPPSPPPHAGPARPPRGASATPPPPVTVAGERAAEVVVYGGTPAGVAAAVAAARMGRTVILAEPTDALGGDQVHAYQTMMDMSYGPRYFVVTRGLFLEVFRKLGYVFDPQTAARVFHDMVTAEKKIRLIYRARLVRAERKDAHVTAVVVQEPGGDYRLSGERFVDATNDADLAAAAGVPHSLGREAGGPDRRMQSATLIFRVTGVDWPALVAARFGSGRGDRLVWGFSKIVAAYRPRTPGVAAYDLNLGRLPDGSVVINSINIFGVDGTDPRSAAGGRRRALEEIPHFIGHLRGHLPGFSRAEFLDAAPGLYVRETRLIHGLYTLTAKDVLSGRVFEDQIGAASYPIDLHPYGPGDGNPHAPVRRIYTIPLRSLIPQKVEGLLVASRALGATYEAAGSVRVMPSTMVVGEAAGVAAAISIDARALVHGFAQRPDLVARVQEALRRTGAFLLTPDLPEAFRKPIRL
ncbi:MAG: FAD-dependent oxidoreductase [Armatimonadetes bacterium]|nr:FAD-dependent oxidoreductase [Armatimonadota bacterium]